MVGVALFLYDWKPPYCPERSIFPLGARPSYGQKEPWVVRALSMEAIKLFLYLQQQRCYVSNWECLCSQRRSCTYSVYGGSKSRPALLNYSSLPLPHPNSCRPFLPFPKPVCTPSSIWKTHPFHVWSCTFHRSRGRSRQTSHTYYYLVCFLHSG
jgi:hypothetical protein